MLLLCTAGTRGVVRASEFEGHWPSWLNLRSENIAFWDADEQNRQSVIWTGNGGIPPFLIFWQIGPHSGPFSVAVLKIPCTRVWKSITKIPEDIMSAFLFYKFTHSHPQCLCTGDIKFLFLHCMLKIGPGLAPNTLRCHKSRSQAPVLKSD